MSPLWRDELGAHLSPRRLCLVRMKRGVKPTLSAEHEEEFESRQLTDWAAALQGLDAMLTQPGWQGAPLRVVVADSWVRYAIVPWVAELNSGTRNWCTLANCLQAPTVTPSTIGRFACQRRLRGLRVWRARFPWRCSRECARSARNNRSNCSLCNLNSWPHTTAGAIGCRLPEHGSLRWTRAPWPRHGLGRAVGIVFTVCGLASTGPASSRGCRLSDDSPAPARKRDRCSSMRRRLGAKWPVPRPRIFNGSKRRPGS